MNRMNRAANTIVLVTLVGCGGGTPPADRPPTAAGCVAGTEGIAKIAGDGQTAAPGVLLPERPTVRVTCESFANRGTTMPLAGAAVQWQVLSGRGRIDGATSVPKQLDADGVTSVAWTLPNGFGAQAASVTLVAPNRPLAVEFNATVAASTTTAQSCLDAGGTDHGASTVIAADTAWTAAGSPHRGGRVTLTNDAVLEIEQGALVCVDDIDLAVNATGRVVATGSTSAPIRFRGTALRGRVILSHVDGENVPAVGSETHPALSIDDSSFRWTVPRDPAACAQVMVEAGWSVRRTLIEGYGSPACAALRVGWPLSCDFYYCYDTIVEARIAGSLGDSVSVDGESGVSFTNCQVSTGAGHGIVVAATTTGLVTARDCNLFGNDGDAIANRSPGTVDAQGNWWGDPGGPSGPSGDRTSGLVNAASPRAAPLALGY